MKQTKNFLCLFALLAIGAFQFAEIGIRIVNANNTPQTLPFNQNWSNTNLITTDDDWSNVPGIIGYRGDELLTATGVDPRTVLADGSGTPVDVIANQANPNTVTSGGVAEFEITNPTVALQGSGTADAPHIVIHLNTTGQSNIKFAANIRDIDGSADDAIQQVDVQYRVGNTGNYTSVPGGYIADATTGPNLATLVTPMNLNLPANANNQALVQIRVITTNAVGNDEWVGIDDISITADSSGGTPTPTPTPRDANVDFNGDGKSDWVVTRSTDLAVVSQITWFISYNGTNNLIVTPFGLSTDFRVPEDYDGDGKDDIAVWRDNSPGSNRAYFFILQSTTNTLRIEQFGQTGDDPRVVADYDGDNKADLAVYRTSQNGQNFFFYRSSLTNNNFTSVAFGAGTNVRPYVGDFDGDGKADFCVHVNGQFIILRNGGNTVEYINWGASNDFLVPGDFDADGKSDFCVVRQVGNQWVWFILERDGGGTGANGIAWGLVPDTLAPGDYDGDGRQDVAVWRSNPDPAMNFFYVRRSSDNTLLTHEWGRQGDRAEAFWYVQVGGIVLRDSLQ